MAYPIKKFDPGHTRSKEQLNKNLKMNFASLPKKMQRRRKKKQEVNNDLWVHVWHKALLILSVNSFTSLKKKKLKQ